MQDTRIDRINEKCQLSFPEYFSQLISCAQVVDWICPLNSRNQLMMFYFLHCTLYNTVYSCSSKLSSGGLHILKTNIFFWYVVCADICYKYFLFTYNLNFSFHCGLRVVDLTPVARMNLAGIALHIESVTRRMRNYSMVHIQG